MNISCKKRREIKEQEFVVRLFVIAVIATALLFFVSET